MGKKSSQISNLNLPWCRFLLLSRQCGGEPNPCLVPASCQGVLRTFPHGTKGTKLQILWAREARAAQAQTGTGGRVWALLCSSCCCGGKEQLEELSSDKAMGAQETLPLILKVLKEVGSSQERRAVCHQRAVSTRMGREQLLEQFDRKTLPVPLGGSQD